MISEGKIWINERGETSIKGLYSAGDESMGGISCAATYGWISGENAADYSRGVNLKSIDEKGPEIEEKKATIKEIINRKEGPDWKEVNIALQQLMQDYAGPIRSESLLMAGLEYLYRMRKKVDNSIIARNQWELTRCLETINLMDLGELVFRGALARKETRGLHRRTDYPLTDPTMDGKEVFIRRGDEGKPIIEIKKI
jgi:succinate dehydrogenase/fumarate reductase flavoprotein subunit